MIGFTVAVLVATLLCLAFNTTRWIGVAGAALLAYLYPLSFTALVVIGGITFCYIHHHQRSTPHELPKLPDGRD